MSVIVAILRAFAALFAARVTKMLDNIGATFDFGTPERDEWLERISSPEGQEQILREERAYQDGWNEASDFALRWRTSVRRERVNKADARAVAAQDQAEAWAATNGGPLLQEVDPDGSPVECGCGDCRRDAAYIATMNPGTEDAYRMSACDRHLTSMMAAVLSSEPKSEDAS